MKNSIIVFFLIFCLFNFSCGSKKDYSFASAEVSLISNEGKETITLRSTGYGSDKDEALYNAEKLAFENLFFRGIPNSNFRMPLVSIDESGETNKHKQYFTDFYQKRMRTFIASSYQSTPFQKYKGTYVSTVDLKINVDLLKKDLENKGIIRKFGL